jgi:hypothetical protein
MAEAVYALCAITSLVCTVLLLRSWARSRVALLFWSGVCFAGLAVSNALLFVDLAVVQDVDLQIARNIIGLVSLTVLIVALMWEL